MLQAADAAYTERPQVSIGAMQRHACLFMLLCGGKLKYGTCTKLLAEPTS